MWCFAESPKSPHTLRVGDPVPFYRYRSRQNDYLYTTNAAEINTTTVGETGLYDYTYEGVACRVYPADGSGLPQSIVPLYRYVHVMTGKHFYTTNAREIGTTVPGAIRKSWRSEGIAAFIYPTPQPDTVSFYRYYQKQLDAHLYTANFTEIGTIIVGQVGFYGYKFEDAEGYVYPATSPDYQLQFKKWTNTIFSRFFPFF